MTTLTAPSRNTPFARYIIIGLIAGIAVGFLLNERSRAAIVTADGPLEVKRMEAQMGTRVEPVHA